MDAAPVAYTQSRRQQRNLTGLQAVIEARISCRSALKVLITYQIDGIRDSAVYLFFKSEKKALYGWRFNVFVT
ncbi:hypothetical protein OK016_04200 [Vibrio chagasii]|nr:hypothetical protein [Vibrio chagasii]